MADLQGGPPSHVPFWQDLVTWAVAAKSSILPGMAGAIVRGLVVSGLTFGQRLATIVVGCVTFLWVGPVTGPAASLLVARWSPIPLNLDDVDGAARFVTGVVAVTIVEACLKWAGYWKENPPWPHQMKK